MNAHSKFSNVHTECWTTGIMNTSVLCTDISCAVHTYIEEHICCYKAKASQMETYCLKEVGGEFYGIQGCWSYYQLQICPFFHSILHETKEYISVNGAFMSLIKHNDWILLQIRVNQALSQQHAICHVLDHSLLGCYIFKSDSVTNLGWTHIRTYICTYMGIALQMCTYSRWYD